MIEKILIISLFTIGYCCTFWEGMIFEWIGNELDRLFPAWVNKPLWQCYICCCFWIGTFMHLFIWRESVQEWLLTTIPAMGLNAVISQFTNKTQEVELKEMPEVKVTQSIKSDATPEWHLPKYKGSEGD
jgi:hypothetical protein